MRPDVNSKHLKREWKILSEFYHLRRTAIKDLAAYIGFLAGFIGAAPFAWGLLSDQLASGSFVKGLWYFFGIVVASGLFTGTAGLGIGYVAGVVWEQLHRHRRQEKLRKKALAEAALGSSMGAPPPAVISAPRLQLVATEAAPVPELEGKVLASVRFRPASVELDFSGARIEISGAATIICAGQRLRFPDSGSRDALCSLIGDRVDALRVAASDRLEIHFVSGCEVIVSRNVIAVA